MKKMILMMTMLFSVITLNAQTEAKISNFVYDEVVTLDSTFTKATLFVNANEWIAQNFKSAKDVIQMSDKDAGILLIKGNMPVSPVTIYLTEGVISFTLKIQVKDGKYKYTFSDYFHTSFKGYDGGSLENEKPDCGGMVMVKKGWLQVKEMADNGTKEMIASLNESLSKKGLVAKSDW